MRFFNTAGPIRRDDHYYIPPLERLDKAEMLRLIDQKKYFVLHAPRQTGKTSSLFALRDYLNAEGRYRCVYCNVEIAQSAREQVKQGMQAILNQIASEARITLRDEFVRTHWREILEQSGEHAALGEMFTQWAEQDATPLVLLIDEIDALVGDTLISVLRQLRAGYANRPALFPQSIILCGVRDVRDYRLHSSSEKAVITGGSAFNIKARSLRLRNFMQPEIETLYQQHTRETGQTFQTDALERAWDYTRGQPWLVNALGYEVCFEMKAGQDRLQPITAEMMAEAKERLIQRRETHLDQLTDKLREPRVKRVIEPILTGQQAPEKLTVDDVQYVEDLGLITTRGQIQIANRIYQEVIPRALTYTTQLTISQETLWYVNPETGRLDMDKLLAAFQQFFRQHSEHWIERFDYKEAGPQLLLQAFLQRIVNSGGRVEREYGLGRLRTDLLVVWKSDAQQLQRVALELKILYGSLEKTIQEGLAQTWNYMDRCGTEEGHLIIFNCNPEVSWDDKIFRREAIHQGKPIIIWGM